jgi:cytochrome c biogenesis protein CcmG/thiol:disulfide interchange protein DsbE
MRKIIPAIALLAVVAAGIWYLTADTGKSNTVRNAETGVTIGKLAPEFNLPDLNGKIVSTRNEGKVTVLNFWATWCPPCREEMPELQQFAVPLRPDIVFYAVNIQEPAAKVAGFLAQNKYAMPVLLDSDGAVAAAFRINAIPTTIILDKAGVVRYRKTGGVVKTELEKIIKGF